VLKSAQRRTLKADVEGQLEFYQKCARAKTTDAEAELLPRDVAMGMLIFRLREGNRARYMPFTRGCCHTSYRTLSRAITHALYTYEEMDEPQEIGTSLSAGDMADAVKLVAKAHADKVHLLERFHGGFEIIPATTLHCARCDGLLHFWPLLRDFVEMVGCYRCDCVQEIDGYQRTLEALAEEFNQVFQDEQKVSGTLRECYETLPGLKRAWNRGHPRANVFGNSFYFEYPPQEPTYRIVWSEQAGLLYWVNLTNPPGNSGFHTYEKWEGVKTLEAVGEKLGINPDVTLGWFWTLPENNDAAPNEGHEAGTQAIQLGGGPLADRIPSLAG
jgi:hypothetical protein